MCGCLCGGSGGALAYVRLSFDYGMKLYGKKHLLYIVVWKKSVFYGLVTGVLYILYIHLQIPEHTQLLNTMQFVM